jgi:predicted nucleic acid-binding protein
VTPPQTVVVDANILINLGFAGRLDLLGQLSGLEFVSPPEVLSEILRPEHQAGVREALRRGELREVPLDDLEGLALFAGFRAFLGAGESACLALAAVCGWMIASDEKRAFLREATRHLGNQRILNTPGLLLLGIRRGALTVEEADGIKQLLERHRFRMAFGSFRDLLA